MRKSTRAPGSPEPTAVAPRRSSRAAILEAATASFVERGYTRTSVREIAADAGVDPALVIRHFGSKENLFLEALDLTADDSPAFDGPLDSLAERLIESMLAPDDHARSVFLALLRASDSDLVSSRLRRVHDEFFVIPLRNRLTGPDADVRARLAASLVGGLLYSLWAVGDLGLHASDRDVVVARYAPLLQSLITPEQ